jgi:hypothetical protein
MSASQHRIFGAIALELAAAVEEYARASDQLVATWLDMELYQAVSRQVDHMRMLCASLPEVSLPWVEVLIAHTELVHCLWKHADKAVPGEELARCRAQHVAAVHALREKCRVLRSVR